LHPSGVAKSSTSFGFGKGGKVTSAGWQVTLCDLIWHVISRSGVLISITKCYIQFTLLYFTLPLTFPVNHFPTLSSVVEITTKEVKKPICRLNGLLDIDTMKPLCWLYRYLLYIVEPVF